jgi:hypothetical protein
MLKLKSQLTCSYCSKIFKDPIDLPCDESICREHLSEKEVVKEHRIICKDCQQEFKVNDDEFRSNKTLKKLIASQSYLSEEEKSLKQDLEVSIGKFFKFYEELIENRNKIVNDVFNHFEEMRFQVDEQREELKKKIDDISLTMIDKIKKHEEIYLKNLKEKFGENSFSFDETRSLENEMNEMEETFRNPNLLIETILEMQQKQEESLNDIQFKINQINQVKDNLEAKNKFKANLFLLNQEGGSFFGSLKLNEHPYKNSLKSKILKDEQQCSELLKLCKFSSNDKWSLLYRGTRDGFGSSDFHSKCDGHANTLTILKAKESKFIFGGFTTTDWDSSSRWKSDPYAFIFSLTNRANKSIKMKIKLNEHHRAIDCDARDGPTFGCDIFIADNANTTNESHSNLGFTYKHPQYTLGTIEAQSFLAGSFHFQLDEIEVYQKE